MIDPGLGRLSELAAWWGSCHGGSPGDEPAPRRARLVRVGAAGTDADDDTVDALARVAGVGLRDVVPPDDATTDAAVEHGRAVVDEEVDAGADLLVAAERSPAGSPVALAAAAAVAVMTGREPTAVVGVPPGADGRLDDGAWMRAVPVVRAHLRDARPAGRDPSAVLARLGSPELAALVGVVAQAAVRRTPLVLDGPVTTAAALLAEPLEPGARDRWLAGSASPDPAAGHALDVLGLDPVVDLGVWTGRGTGALVAVTVLRAALAAAPPP